MRQQAVNKLTVGRKKIHNNWQVNVGLHRVQIWKKVKGLSVECHWETCRHRVVLLCVDGIDLGLWGLTTDWSYLENEVCSVYSLLLFLFQGKQPLLEGQLRVWVCSETCQEPDAMYILAVDVGFDCIP